MPSPITAVERIRMATDDVEREGGEMGVPGQLRWVEERYGRSGLKQMTLELGSKLSDQHRFDESLPSYRPTLNGVKLAGVVLLASGMEQEQAVEQIRSLPVNALGTPDELITHFELLAHRETVIKLEGWRNESYEHTPEEDRSCRVGVYGVLLAVFDMPAVRAPLTEESIPTDQEWDDALAKLLGDHD